MVPFQFMEITSSKALPPSNGRSTSPITLSHLADRGRYAVEDY